MQKRTLISFVCEKVWLISIMLIKDFVHTGAVAVFTLNRPEARNAMSRSLLGKVRTLECLICPSC